MGTRHVPDHKPSLKKGPRVGHEKPEVSQGEVFTEKLETVIKKAEIPTSVETVLPEEAPVEIVEEKPAVPETKVTSVDASKDTRKKKP